MLKRIVDAHNFVFLSFLKIKVMLGDASNVFIHEYIIEYVFSIVLYMVSNCSPVFQFVFVFLKQCIVKSAHKSFFLH